MASTAVRCTRTPKRASQWKYANKSTDLPSVYLFRDVYSGLIKRDVSRLPQNQIESYHSEEEHKSRLHQSLKPRQFVLKDFEKEARRAIKMEQGFQYLLDELYQQFDKTGSVVQEIVDEINIDQWEKDNKRPHQPRTMHSVLESKRETRLTPQMLNDLIGQLRKRDYSKMCLKIIECSKFYENETKLLENNFKRDEVKLRNEEQEIRKKVAQLSEMLIALKSEPSKGKSQRIKEEIERQEESLKECLAQQQQFKESLIIFYRNILQLGYDVRNTGLIWIIKRLAELGHRTEEAQLPRFLDQRAGKFLLEQSAMEIEIEITEGRKKQLLEEYNHQFKAEIKNTPELSFSQISAENIRERIQQRRQENFNQSLSELCAESPWGRRQIAGWKSLARDSYGTCKDTSGALIYKEIKHKLTACGINSKANKMFKEQLAKNRNLDKESMIRHFNQLDQFAGRKTKELLAKREREKKRILQLKVRSEKEYPLLIATIAALFGAESAQKIIKANLNLLF